MDISVIIPCFNHAGTLARAIESALPQTGVIEVLVVDDDSTDASADMVRSLSAKDARVRLCPMPQNSGPGAARNHGVQQAKGSHIVFLDADDELVGNFTGLALPLFAQNPDLVVAKCEVEFFDPVKGYILPDTDPRHTAAILSSSCGMVMRRSSFLRMGGFSEKPVFRGPMGGEDVAFMHAVMAHFQPIARIEPIGYRVWSCAGSHLDRFLVMTRLTNAGGFEFIAKEKQQIEADKLADAVSEYLTAVQQSIANISTKNNS